MSFSKFFSKVQETNWYQDFLQPVINSVTNKQVVLDVGTGSGKLLKMLVGQKSIGGVGIDIDPSMLAEAKNKLKGTDIKLMHIEQDENYPFLGKSFDVVCICNVLFNMKESAGHKILDESIRVLKENGKIIILTPTGKGKVSAILRNYFRLKNYSLFIWFISTRNRGLMWHNDSYVERYSIMNGFKYSRELVFHGFALMEVIDK